MTEVVPSADGCKGSFRELSPIKRLGFVRSYPAATLAMGFFVVTCFVLFKDVADGAPVTPDHVMSFAVLVGTFASGHLLSGQLKQWRLLPSIGLLLVFIAGTFYCVTSAGGRNASVLSLKADDAHKRNEDRARTEADLAAARDRLSNALEAEEAECGSGEGGKCKARRATRVERQAYVDILEARLRLMDPARVEYPELRHSAKVFAAFPGVTASEATIFEKLVLFFPFAKSMVCEFAAVVFGAIGFRTSHEGRHIQRLVPSTLLRSHIPALGSHQSHSPTAHFHSPTHFVRSTAQSISERPKPIRTFSVSSGLTERSQVRMPLVSDGAVLRAPCPVG